MSKNKSKIINLRMLLFIVFIVLLIIIVPRVTNMYSMTVMNSALMYFIAALGISVMLGMGGQISFATSAFMGIGAFTTANLSRNFGVHPFPSLIIAVIFTALCAWIIGLALFRLKGSYFTFASIALTQIMYNIYTNWKPVTGGPDGMSRIPKLDLFFFTPKTVMDYFYVIIAFCVICALIVERIRNSSLGRSLAAIRDNEIAAMSLSINIYRTKVLSFVIAGAFAGLSGALIAHHNTFISAAVFTFDQSTNYVVMAMLGGVGSTSGIFIGSLIVTMLPEWLRPLKDYIRIIYGIAVMLLMIFMPMGVMGMVKAVGGRVNRSKVAKQKK